MDKRRSPKPRRKGADKRSLSTARVGGTIERGGDRELSARLSAALNAARKQNAVSAELTHQIHTYPARMHPATARHLVEALRGSGRTTILDPFCGSGTTLVEARHAGAFGIGVDANPLAVAIACAKTWTAPKRRRMRLFEAAKRIAGLAREEGKRARRSGYQAPIRKVPEGVDRKQRNRRISPWFAPHVRAELETLRTAIDDGRARDEEISDLLEVALSGILYKVSRRASDTDPSRVERRVGRGAAARLFLERVEQLCRGLDDLSKKRAPMPDVLPGDARALELEDASVNAIITSPPYAGTYDYTEQHRLRLDFLGWSVDRFAGAEIGSRRSFRGNADDRRRGLRAWQQSLRKSFAQMHRVLEPGGMVAVVLGDSLAGSRAIYVRDTIDATAKGFEVVAWARQPRPKLGARELRAFSRGKFEHIVLLKPV